VAVYGPVSPSLPENRAALYDGAGFTQLGVLPGFLRTFPSAFVGPGTIVGECSGTKQNPNGRAAFIWHHGTMHEIAMLVRTNQAIEFDAAMDANADGTVAAYADIGHHVVAAILDPIHRRPGDTDCDQRVNVIDLLAVLRDWGPCRGCPTDFTGDDLVASDDLMIVLDAWRS
jgi:hypothetical protein